jgi:thiamine kinase-like enzyme
LLPSFKAAAPGAIHAEKVVGGITNTIFKVSIATDPRSSVLVRVFGAQGVISGEARARENRIFAQLAERGISPALLGLFDGGRVEQWLPARCLTLDEMRDDTVVPGIANAVANLHQFCPADEEGKERSSSVWRVMDGWLAVAQRLNLPPEECDVDAIAREVRATRRVLLHESPASRLVFAHCDLLAANILISLDGQRRITLIDYEYSCTNYRGFDIGNFFCEAMGGTTDGVVDASKYPSPRCQALFCRTYLERTGPHSPSDADVSALVGEANQYGLLSHLYWAAWAVAQSASSTVDFPYLLFARNRFRQFLASKDKYLTREKTVALAAVT